MGATVGLPLTGSGGTTADVSVDLIAGAVYQHMKLVDGTAGSTVVAVVKATTPSAGDGGIVVRPIMPVSTGQIGTVGQAQVTPGSSDNYWWVRTVGASGAGSTIVDVNSISSSTAHLGDVSISNPTTEVTLSAGSSANTIGAVAQGAGSTSIAPWYVISTAGAGSTTVDAQASSVGSTKLFGQVTVANPTTAVTVSSGVILAAGSSSNTLGSVTLAAASTAVVHGAVAVTSGVVLAAGSSANTIGAVAQGAGNSSATGPWLVGAAPISSANTSRTSIATSIDIQVVAASSRRALVLSNVSTSQGIALGFSTAAVTTALANVDFYIPAASFVVMGAQGTMPLYGGPIRGITYTSTTVAAQLNVTQFF